MNFLIEKLYLLIDRYNRSPVNSMANELRNLIKYNISESDTNYKKIV